MVKYLIIILLVSISAISYSQVYVRSADVMYFDEGWVNLAQYFPNGVIPFQSDISDELQAAIDTKKNVIIPKSYDATKSVYNYFISKTIRLANDGQIIQGWGYDYTTLKVYPSRSTDTMFYITGNYVQLRDMLLTGGSKYGIFGDSAHHCKYSGLYLDGFTAEYPSDTGYGFFLNICFLNTVTNCIVLHNDIGFRISRGSATNIVTSQFGSNNCAGIYLQDCNGTVSIYGGSVETAGRSDDYLYILNNSSMSLFGVNYESAKISDIYVIGTTTSRINIQGCALGVIDLDGGTSRVEVNINDCHLEYSSTECDMPIKFTPSQHHIESRVNIVNTSITRNPSHILGIFTVDDYSSDMYKGSYDSLWKYFYYSGYKNINARDTGSFSGELTADTVVIPNSTVNDSYTITLTGQMVGVNESIVVESTSTGFIVRRGAGTTPNLKYNWIRIK